MLKNKKASLVIGTDKVRCIYEIEGSGQKYTVRYPFTKTLVSVSTVEDKDIFKSLELMEILSNDGMITNKGVGVIMTKLISDIDFFSMKSRSNRSRLEEAGVIKDGYIAPYGVKLIIEKMRDELTSIEGGNIALDECDNNELLKITF